MEIETKIFFIWLFYSIFALIIQMIIPNSNLIVLFSIILTPIMVYSLISLLIKKLRSKN
jgi:hypothetical protein